MNRWTLIVFSVVAAILFSLSWAVEHFRSNAILYKEQRDKSLATIVDMQNRQRDAAALDAKYTGELADAKRTIEDLQRDVASGKRRLQLNATCSKSDATEPGGMGNASTPELSADAKRDYYRLRDGIETVTGQVNYLQDYIKQQCLR